MTNYVEILHEYDDTEDPGFVSHSGDAWYAARSSGSYWDYHKESEQPEIVKVRSNNSGWNINGTSLVLWHKEDLAGLRKLLDALEPLMVE